MLAMSRGLGETCHIGDDVTVTVESIKADSADLLISAPQNAHLTAHGMELLGGDNVITVRRNETVKLEDPDVTITLLDIRTTRSFSSGRVRFGIEAPIDLPILRSELYDASTRDSLAARIEASEPEGYIAVDFGPGFTEEEMATCLSYISELYRSRGGTGLKIVRSQTMAPDLAEVPDAH